MNNFIENKNELCLGLTSFLCKTIQTNILNDNDDKKQSSLNSTHKMLPTSIMIYGRFQNLLNLLHINLCQYVNIERQNGFL